MKGIAVNDNNVSVSSAKGLKPGMFSLDHDFLVDLGIGDLPSQGERRALRDIYVRLEMLVGERLTEGLPEELLDEFGFFVDQDAEAMRSWLDGHIEGWVEDDKFRALVEANPEADIAAIVSEYGAMLWLSLNRPDYPEVVQAALADIKRDIRARVDEFRSQYMQEVSEPTVPVLRDIWRYLDQVTHIISEIRDRVLWLDTRIDSSNPREEMHPQKQDDTEDKT